MSSTPTPAAASDTAKYMTLLAAFLGWMFDGFEMGLFPLIGQPALADLLGPENSADTAKWFGAIIAVFLVGAASGGVLFGWLGDKIGRVRAMSISIFTYAIFTGLCGFATEAWHIAGLRFIASLGMGGEWSLGVALVNEIWPGKSRALIAGLIGAAANIGYMLVAVLSMALISFIGHIGDALLAMGVSQSATEYLLRNSAWRFLMISGALPALLIFLIRLFVPESEKWRKEHARGATTHWASADLLGVLVGSCATLVIIWAWSPLGTGTLTKWVSADGVSWAATAITLAGLAVTLGGFLHPVRQYLRRAEAAGSLSAASRADVLKMMLFGAGIGGVALLGTWGMTQWAPRWAVTELAPDPKMLAKEWTQFWQAFGATVGTFLAALAAGRFGRRITYVVLCAGSIVTALYLFHGNDAYNAKFLVSVFACGAFTASFYGFFPLYLPELFPTAVRATGQGFAFNFGRILAAVGGLQMANLLAFFGNSFAKAASVVTLIYVVGAFIIWIGPETKGRELPE